MNLHHYVDTHLETAMNALHRDRNHYFDTRKQRTDITPHLSIELETGDGRYALITDISEQDEPLLEALFNGLSSHVENVTLTYIRHNKIEQPTLPRRTFCAWLFAFQPTVIESHHANVYADVMALFYNKTHLVVRRVKDDKRHVASTAGELNHLYQKLRETDDTKLVTTAHTVDGTDVSVNPVKVIATTTYTLEGDTSAT